MKKNNDVILSDDIYRDYMIKISEYKQLTQIETYELFKQLKAGNKKCR